MTGSQLIRWATGALVALGVWFAGLVALTAIAEPTRAVIVFAPDRAAMMSAIATADVALLDVSGRMLNVAGTAPGFVARLYAGGAWLVLPALASGCIAPPSRTAARRQSRG